jgi:hypothetical protein
VVGESNSLLRKNDADQSQTKDWNVLEVCKYALRMENEEKLRARNNHHQEYSLVTTGFDDLLWQARNFDNLLSVHSCRQEHNYPVSRNHQTTSRLITNGRTCVMN